MHGMDGLVDMALLPTTQLEQMHALTQDPSSSVPPHTHTHTPTPTPNPFAKYNSTLRVLEIIFNLEINEKTHSRLSFVYVTFHQIYIKEKSILYYNLFESLKATVQFQVADVNTACAFPTYT